MSYQSGYEPPPSSSYVQHVGNTTTPTTRNLLYAVAAIGALILIIGLFLPWEIRTETLGNAKTETVTSGIAIDQVNAVIMFAFGSINLALALLGFFFNSKWFGVGLIGFGLLSTGYVALIMLGSRINSVYCGVASDVAGTTISQTVPCTRYDNGLGLYLSLIGGLVIVAGGILTVLGKSRPGG